ncbi:MAG TPA: TolC family protein [Terracidiphilus sp.]|nr:TolC family protein [Terracidiphilus sp.]
MKLCVPAVIALAAWTAGLAWSQMPGATDAFSGAAAMLGDSPRATEPGTALTLDETENIALAVNPEIQVAMRRVAIAEAHVPVAGALDDPEAMYRGWGVPLKKPWDYNAAQNMFSVSQAFAGGNKRALRTNVAQTDVDEAKANLAAVRLDISVRVCKAFFDLLITEDEARVHEQHVGITQQAIEAARIKYSVGNVPQQDVLKAQMALTQLAEHSIHYSRDADVARARLNTLLARRPDAPFSVKGEHAVLAPLPSLDPLESLAMSSRPDLMAAKAAADRSHKEQALASKAHTPDFTISAGYMLMPTGQNYRNDYMIEGSMNLPWLNRKKHDAEIAEATVKATEQDAELEAMRNTARGQIAEALVEALAAQKLALLYHRHLRPQAEATLQASVIAYENNKTGFLDLLDSQMRVIDLDQEWIDAIGEFDARLADLEMAAGAPLNNLQPASREVK